MTSDQGMGVTLGALDAALEEAADEQAAANAAAGRRTVALARVLAAAGAAPELMLDLDVVRVVKSSRPRREHVAHRALVAEVACALGVGEHTAAGWLADARVLATKAAGTLDALCAGVITYQHAAKLAGVVADLPAGVASQVEAVVLPRAAQVTAARFAALARTARERLHPVPAEIRHRAAALRAGVWVDDGLDGMSWLTAHLPTVVAHAAYDRITRAAVKAKQHADPRGIGQLRAAAMTALLLDDGQPATGRAAAADDSPPLDPVPPDPLTTLVRSVRPTVHVTIPAQTLAGAGEQPGLVGGTVPVDAETARHLTAQAPSLRRIWTDPATGAMLTVDRRSYVVPADLRAFLTARDITCRFPGCTIPATRCDVDHTTDWAHGGTTDADNLAALCRAHHTVKHESRWRVEQLHNGVLAWTSPRGRTYLTTPGSTDHTLNLLDQWAAEAAALATEKPPPAPAPRSVTSDQDRPAEPPDNERSDADPSEIHQVVDTAPDRAGPPDLAPF